MAIVKFSVGDVLVMKKKHPCASDKFIVIRCGSDVRIVCRGCGRDMLFPRETLEKSIKKVIPKEESYEKEGM